MNVCDAELHIQAEDGDGKAVLRCQLDRGHTGDHFCRWQKHGGEPAEVEWSFDDRDHEAQP